MRNFFVALAVFIIVVGGLGTLLVRFVTRKPPPPPTTGQTAPKEKFSDRTVRVRYTIDGAILGAENHRAIRITVDPSGRTIEVLKGYNEEVIRSQGFVNDPAAFTEFLQALDKFGYTKENSKVSKDEKGECPLGFRYIYEATYESDPPLRSWSSTCGTGNRLQGNTPGIQQLFQLQIPNYNKLTSDITLYGHN